MKLTLNIFCLLCLPICFGFLAKSEYPYLFYVVINKKFVPGQKELRVCAAIELVEDQFYLLPKKCFDNPSSNQDIKVALQRKNRLKFSPLIYEAFVLRWETFSNYVILEKDSDYDLEIVLVPEIHYSMKNSVVMNRTNYIIATSTPEYELISSTEFKEKVTYEPKYGSAYERRKRYMNNKAHFKDRLTSHYRRKRFEEPRLRLPPFIQNEENLPPRILLTVPNNPQFTDCFMLGWGSFFSKNKSLAYLEGLELRRVAVDSIKPGGVDPVTGLYFSEIWFERKWGQEYVEDLGSPMLCRVRNRGNIEVIIGVFTGGNSSLNHEVDSYRSFMGEFNYITHWAIGTNVSITGDPLTWTLWPVEYNEELKSKGLELKLKAKITSILFFLLLYII